MGSDKLASFTLHCNAKPSLIAFLEIRKRVQKCVEFGGEIESTLNGTLLAELEHLSIEIAAE